MFFFSILKLVPLRNFISI